MTGGSAGTHQRLDGQARGATSRLAFRNVDELSASDDGAHAPPRHCSLLRSFLVAACALLDPPLVEDLPLERCQVLPEGLSAPTDLRRLLLHPAAG